MAKLSEAEFNTFLNLGKKIEDLNGHSFLEDAAQDFTKLVQEYFDDSILLMRLFATVPYQYLPVENQRFVDNLAASANIAGLVKPNTSVLSLLGTSGVNPNWNNRRNSQGHVGIPLVSAAFIDSIPMMSRLLKQLGVDLSWLDGQDLSIAKRITGRVTGKFYVPESAQTTDSKGRKIIAAQDFVSQYQVRTVFGTGGAYPVGDLFIVAIIFNSEVIPEGQVDRFATFINNFKIATMGLSKWDSVFSNNGHNW